MNKIVISSNIVWTIANFRKDLIIALKNRGYEVICIAAQDEFSSLSEDILKALGAHFIPVNLNRKGINPMQDLLYFFKLHELYRQIKPKAILHYTPKPNIYGTLAARMAATPSINTINGLGSGMIGGGTVTKIMMTMYRFSLKFSNRIFFQNQTDMDFFMSKGLAKKDLCRYVPGSGIDTNEYDGCIRKNTDNIPIFLLVARLLKDKGVYEYVEACRQLKKKYPNVSCLLGGILDSDNPSAVREKELWKWVNEGVIKYLGKTEDIKKFFRKADVVVLPSYREGLSRLLLEAASCSKPIIATDVPGCKELILDGRSGFLCHPADVTSLENSMEKMIKSVSKLQQMGQAGRAHVKKNFSKDIVTKIYLQAIEEITI